MKTLGLISSLFIMLITTACDGNKVIRPKGSDREWQQKQEQIERQEEEQEELREREERRREVMNFTPSDN